MKFKKVKERFLKEKLPKIVGIYINMLAVISPSRSAKTALKLFCTPRAGKIKSFQRKFLDSSIKKTFYLDDKAIQTYRWQGKGPSILLAHGWESNSWRWRKLIRELRRYDYDIYAMDAPAHGGSGGKMFNAGLYAEMIDVVVKEFHPEVLIGHSIGSYASLLFASKMDSSDIRKIILLASPDKLTDLTKQFYKTLGLNRRTQQAYEDYFKEHFNHPMTYYSASLFAAEVEVPGIIIHDQEDQINFYHEGQAISRAWKNCKLYTTNGLGHSLQAPEVYTTIVSELKGF